MRYTGMAMCLALSCIAGCATNAPPSVDSSAWLIAPSHASTIPRDTPTIQVTVTNLYRSGFADLVITNHGDAPFTIGPIRASSHNVYFTFYDHKGDFQYAVPGGMTIGDWKPVTVDPGESSDLTVSVRDVQPVSGRARHVVACWSHNPNGTPLDQPVMSDAFENPWWWPWSMNDIQSADDDAGIRLRLVRDDEGIHAEIFNASAETFRFGGYLDQVDNLSVAYYDEDGGLIVANPRYGFSDVAVAATDIPVGAGRIQRLWFIDADAPSDAAFLVVRWTNNFPGTQLPGAITSNPIRLTTPAAAE